MLEAHKHLNISGDHFDVVGQIVFETLDELIAIEVAVLAAALI